MCVYDTVTFSSPGIPSLLSPDPALQASMNAAFSAQRCGMVLDACILGAGHSAFLQQVRS